MTPIPRRRIVLSPGWNREALRLIQRGELLEGPEIARFERAMAEFIGVRHVVGVSSARVGLWLTAQALGLEPGDEVICPVYGFYGIIEVLRSLKLVPVFVDADPDTFTLDPTALEAARTPRTRAILITHLFGQPCDLDPIVRFAAQNSLILLEDCAHALGATVQGKRVGSFGRAGFFSFGPGKNLPCFGGGLVATDDEELALRLRREIDRSDFPSTLSLFNQTLKMSVLAWGTGPFGFRWAGYPLLRVADRFFPSTADRLVEEPSVRDGPLFKTNRLTNLQAAAGLAQLPLLGQRNAQTIRNAEYLRQALQDLEILKFQQGVPGSRSIFLYLRVLAPERELIRRELLRLGLDTKRDDMTNSGGPSFPVAARLVRQSLELPNGHLLTQTELDRIAWAVRRAVSRRWTMRPKVRTEIPAPTSTLVGR